MRPFERDVDVAVEVLDPNSCIVLSHALKLKKKIESTMRVRTRWRSERAAVNDSQGAVWCDIFLLPRMRTNCSAGWNSKEGCVDRIDNQRSCPSRSHERPMSSCHACEVDGSPGQEVLSDPRAGGTNEICSVRVGIGRKEVRRHSYRESPSIISEKFWWKNAIAIPRVLCRGKIMPCLFDVGSRAICSGLADM